MAKIKWTEEGIKEQIATLEPYLEQKFMARNNRIRDVYAHRFMTRSSTVPESFQKYTTPFKSSLIWDYIRRSVSIMATQLPVPSMIPQRAGLEAQERSSETEIWLNGAYDTMNQTQNIFPLIVDGLVADGMSTWKMILRRDAWLTKRDKDEPIEDYQKRLDKLRYKTFPFSWEHVPALGFYPIYDEDGLATVLDVREADAVVLAKRYNLYPGRNGALSKERAIGEKYPTTAKFKQYWDRNTFAYMVDDEVVKLGEHGYGIVPYFIAYANVCSSHKVEDQGVSLTFPLISIQDDLEDIMTIRKNWAFLTGFPTPVLKPTSEESQLSTKTKVTFEPGVIYSPPDGFEITWPSLPATGTELQNFHQQIKETADSLSLAPILQGTLSGSDTSGVTAAMMVQIAKAVFGAGLESTAKGFNDMAEFMLRMIDTVLKEPVPLWVEDEGKGKWFQLGPEDIQGYYKVKHSLKPVIAAEQQIKYTMLQQAQQIGAVSMNHLREQGLALAAPEKMEQEVSLERLLAKPEVDDLVLEKILERIRGEPPKPPLTPGGTEVQAQGTPETLPIAPGGFGQPALQGVQRPVIPGEPIGP